MSSCVWLGWEALAAPAAGVLTGEVGEATVSASAGLVSFAACGVMELSLRVGPFMELVELLEVVWLVGPLVGTGLACSKRQQTAPLMMSGHAP